MPCPACSLRYYCIDDLIQVVEEQLAKLKDEHHPICRVPVITSLDEEHLIVSTSSKVCRASDSVHYSTSTHKGLVT